MAVTEQRLGQEDILAYAGVHSAERYVRLATALAQLQVVRHVLWQDLLRAQESAVRGYDSMGRVELGSGRFITVSRHLSERGVVVDGAFIHSDGSLTDRGSELYLRSSHSVLSTLSPVGPGQPHGALTAQAILDSGLPGEKQSMEFAAHAGAAYEFVQAELHL